MLNYKIWLLLIYFVVDMGCFDDILGIWKKKCLNICNNDGVKDEIVVLRFFFVKMIWKWFLNLFKMWNSC